MENKKVFIVATVSLAFGVISLLFSVYLWISQPKIVVFDARNTTNTFLEQVAKLNLTEQEKQTMVKRYENIVQRVISEYEAKNYIVLAKNAVISKDDDITADIRTKIAARMKTEK